MAAPTVRARVTPAAGLTFSRPVSTQIGDALIAFFWEQTGAGIPTHFVESGTGWVEILSLAHDDGSTDGRLSVAYKIATASGSGGEQPYTTSNGATTRLGVVVLQVGTHSLGATAKGAAASASASQTNNAIPNPPAVTLGTARDWLVIAAAGWHLGAAADAIPTVPTNYANLQHVAGSSASELATAERSLTAAASEDPGTFGDNVTPNGTAIVTVGLPNPVERSAAIGATADISGSGTVIPAVDVFERSAAIGATADIASSATFFSVFERSAAIAATAEIASSGESESGTVVHERSASLSATGSIASSATFFSVFERSVALAATGDIATDFERVLLRSASVAATGSISVSGLREVSRSASLTATATISTDFERVHFRSASIEGIGNVSVSGAPDGVFLRSASLTATAGISVSGQVQGAVERSASFTASAGISVSGVVSRVWNRSVAFSAVAGISASGSVPPLVAFAFPTGRAPVILGASRPRIESAGTTGRIQESNRVLVEV